MEKKIKTNDIHEKQMSVITNSILKPTLDELSNHDCTAGEEDGCQGCVKLYEAISENRI